MEKRALFLDMDGTTLNDQVEIPKENLEAMKAALKAGHEIVVTTGRPTASTRKLLEQWGLDKIGCRYVISFNGGMVLDAISGDIIYEKTIPVEWMKLVAHEAKQRGVYVHTYEGDHVLSDQDCDEYRSYVKRLRISDHAGTLCYRFRWTLRCGLGGKYAEAGVCARGTERYDLFNHL